MVFVRGSHLQKMCIQCELFCYNFKQGDTTVCTASTNTKWRKLTARWPCRPMGKPLVEMKNHCLGKRGWQTKYRTVGMFVKSIEWSGSGRERGAVQNKFWPSAGRHRLKKGNKEWAYECETSTCKRQRERNEWSSKTNLPTWLYVTQEMGKDFEVAIALTYPWPCLWWSPTTCKCMPSVTDSFNNVSSKHKHRTRLAFVSHGRGIQIRNQFLNSFLC